MPLDVDPLVPFSFAGLATPVSCGGWWLVHNGAFRGGFVSHELRQQQQAGRVKTVV